MTSFTRKASIGVVLAAALTMAVASAAATIHVCLAAKSKTIGVSH